MANIQRLCTETFIPGQQVFTVSQRSIPNLHMKLFSGCGNKLNTIYKFSKILLYFETFCSSNFCTLFVFDSI